MIQKHVPVVYFKCKVYCKVTSCQIVPATLIMPFKIISLNFYEKEWEFDHAKAFVALMMITYF